MLESVLRRICFGCVTVVLGPPPVNLSADLAESFDTALALTRLLRIDCADGILLFAADVRVS